MLDDKLINDEGRPPITESSFAAEEASEDEVDTDAVALWLPIGPCDVVGADVVLISCLRVGVDWKAYGWTGAVAPRYELLFCP